MVRRNIEHYSLDAIISVGYRVNSNESDPKQKDMVMRLIMAMLS